VVEDKSEKGKAPAAAAATAAETAAAAVAATLAALTAQADALDGGRGFVLLLRGGSAFWLSRTEE
jgi:hypothetical protein